MNQLFSRAQLARPYSNLWGCLYQRPSVLGPDETVYRRTVERDPDSSLRLSTKRKSIGLYSPLCMQIAGWFPWSLQWRFRLLCTRKNTEGPHRHLIAMFCGHTIYDRILYPSCGQGVSTAKMRNGCRILRIRKANSPYNKHFGWFCSVLIINRLPST